jgi:hypothetical protein
MTLIARPDGAVTQVTLNQVVRAETQASIDRYLGAGDQMAGVMDATLKVCGGLFVLVLAAWALGVLPAAVRLF